MIANCAPPCSAFLTFVTKEHSPLLIIAIGLCSLSIFKVWLKDAQPSALSSMNLSLAIMVWPYGTSPKLAIDIGI